ncbi:MAG: 3'(2'),5'-bisphosphate nucleotidase CysQ [Bacteroidetes bacterium]|nr:3'(2'),5'-bisphosphate nucleotidase CysQ [Bacteroidota bacterium]
MDQNSHKQLLETAIMASVEAGKKIIDIYHHGFGVEYKDDQSPLTIADTSANEVINQFLRPTEIPILSEEGRTIPFEERKNWEYFWMVDPLDGTKEFIKRNGEFTVNIALIHEGSPVLGVIYIPVTKTLYFGSEATGSMKINQVEDTIQLETLMAKGNRLPEVHPGKVYTIVGSKSHLTPETEAYFNDLKRQHGEVEILSRGSSLKICMVAEGAADIYPRFAPTMEWDVAAGHAIALYSGAEIVHHDSDKPLVYNKENLRNPWFIVRR